MYYAPTLFAALGQSKEMSLILSGMINICQLIGGTVTTIYFDKLGRRKLCIAGGIMMGIPHAILAVLMGLYSTSCSSHPGPAWFSVALVYIYVLLYAFTYGPLGWAMPAEVYPTIYRARGVGIGATSNWIANFVM